MLPQVAARGSTASLGLRLRQQCQFLTLSGLLTLFFLEEIVKNKGDRHQYRITSCSEMFPLKRSIR
jgi:hypothetical protein